MKRGTVAANSSSNNDEIVVEAARRGRAVAFQGRENAIQIGMLGTRIEARQAQGRRSRGGAGAECLSPKAAEAERARRRGTGIVCGRGSSDR